MKKYIAGLLAVSLVFAACEKKAAPIDDYKVTVEYRSTSPKSIVGDITVNPKDSFYLDFTITSLDDMAYVEIQRNGTRIDTFRLNNRTDKKSFSLLKGYRADSATGDYTYRVLARNDRAIFMGDGGKLLKVTVNPDFNFWSARILQVPDTTAKTNQCYYSVSEGKVYSYTEASSRTDKIDFGYYYDTTRVTVFSNLQPRGHTIYALTNTVSPFQPYDINSWTKNATIFKPITTAFTSVTSAGAIRTAAVATLNTAPLTRFSQTDRSSATLVNTGLNGQVLAFRTTAGKYGVMNVIFTNNNGPNRDSYILLDVKVEK